MYVITLMVVTHKRDPLLREKGTNLAMEGGRGKEDPAIYGTCSE